MQNDALHAILNLFARVSQFVLMVAASKRWTWLDFACEGWVLLEGTRDAKS